MDTVQILIVSDNLSDISEIRSLLSRAGTETSFSVDFDQDPTSALRSLVRNRYDIYLVDQFVPSSNLSGIDFAKKANAGGCRSPILLLTTMEDDEVDWASDDAGAAGYVNKKLDMQERTLLHAIRSAIKHNVDVVEVREQLKELQRQVSDLIHAFDRRP